MAIDRGKLTRRFFHSVDNRDTNEFLAFLTDDILFRFGNADSVKVKAAVGELVSGFFGGINDVQHELESV